LTIGRSFGYDVEPKLLRAAAPDKGVYRIKSIPVPDYVTPGYEVDFQSALELIENTNRLSTNSFQTPDGFFGEIRVEWQLQLQFIFTFPSLFNGCLNLWFKPPAIACLIKSCDKCLAA